MLKKNGFSLIEIIVVVIIIGILTAVAVPIYTTMIDQGEATNAANNLTIIGNAQQVYYLNNSSICTATGSGSTACQACPGCDGKCANNIADINCNLSLNINDTIYSYSCGIGSTSPHGQPGAQCMAILYSNPNTGMKALIFNDTYNGPPNCSDFASGPYCPSTWTNCGNQTSGHSGYLFYVPTTCPS